jgi:hypothetical protein
VPEPEFFEAASAFDSLGRKEKYLKEQPFLLSDGYTSDFGTGGKGVSLDFAKCVY